MNTKKMAYTLSMVVIYVTATMLSSLSILLCDHEHHDHDSSHHNEHCCCHCTTTDEHIAHLSDGCCDHHHTTLGERITQYVVSEKRNNLQDDATLFLAYAPLCIFEELNSVPKPCVAAHPILHGDEAEPLRAAYTSPRSLRAPPALA